MAAEEKPVRHEPARSEEQAVRTLLAVEGAEPRDTTSVGATIEALNRAAALRERQPQAVDVGELLREARDELERRLDG